MSDPVTYAYMVPFNYDTFTSMERRASQIFLKQLRIIISSVKSLAGLCYVGL